MRNIMISLMAGSALAISACSGVAEAPAPVEDDMAMEAEPMAPGNVVDVAMGNPDFSTLFGAVQAAGLVETLSADGPYTVFAPTNAAFDALPDGTVEELTTEDTETLASILTYHVVPGNMMAADVIAAIEEAGAGGLTVETVNGGTLTATLVDGNVMLADAAGNSATVTATDVEASNGVIHVIDTVLMPG